MDGQSEWLLCTVIKIGYGLFSYALKPAKRTSASFMGAILEEYLVLYPVPFIRFQCRDLRQKNWLIQPVTTSAQLPGTIAVCCTGHNSNHVRLRNVLPYGMKWWLFPEH